MIKFGLYALVLVGLIGGTAAWATSGKSIDVRIDGQDRIIHTAASDVHGVLDAAHITVDEHDIVAPDLSAQVHDKGRIIVRRGHLLHLMVNGQAKDVWVNADSVAEALQQLGFTSAEFVSVSRDKRLDSGVTNLTIDTPKRITFLVDGKKLPVLSAGPTVFQAISDAGLYLGPRDIVSAKGNIRDGEVIRIERVTVSNSTQQVAVPFATVTQQDPNSYVGTNSVARAGQEGSARVTYQLIYVDGRYAGRAVLSSVPLSAAVNQIDVAGSKQAPSFVSSATPGSAQAIAAGMVAQHGWGSDQFSCLVSLWNKESGWRTDATNSSGAYGIPQALPGDKMASVGSDWQTNPATQITWGLNYISSVYGTPCAAWAHSQANNWY